MTLSEAEPLDDDSLVTRQLRSRCDDCAEQAIPLQTATLTPIAWAVLGQPGARATTMMVVQSLHTAPTVGGKQPHSRGHSSRSWANWMSDTADEEMNYLEVVFTHSEVPSSTKPTHVYFSPH